MFPKNPTYMYIYIYVSISIYALTSSPALFRLEEPDEGGHKVRPGIGLYTISFYVEDFVHGSIITLLPPPTCIAALLQYDCTTFAQFTTLPPALLSYAIHHTILITAISCTGQPREPPLHRLVSSVKDLGVE